MRVTVPPAESGPGANCGEGLGLAASARGGCAECVGCAEGGFGEAAAAVQPTTEARTSDVTAKRITTPMLVLSAGPGIRVRDA
jgi:hypothetical protein